MNLKTGITILCTSITVAFTATASAAGIPEVDGNRYYELPRYYNSEISVSEAYLAMEHSKDFRHAKGPKPVLIDVRSLREYASGHPDDAYNVPFPTVSGMGGDAAQTPQKLYDEVYRIVKGNLDTPIMTLCRTGHRSVNAGNILARPDLFDVVGQPFTNVRNIWQGFVGQPLYAFTSSNITLMTSTYTTDSGDVLTVLNGGPFKLDLNNDNWLNDDYADVYKETKDVNPDKDGWRNFAGLPWTTKIQKPLAYERDLSEYAALYLTPCTPSLPECIPSAPPAP